MGGPKDGEPPEEGCPGGWYRTRFAQSFRAYRRREGFDNPRVNAQTPELILEAIAYYEEQEAMAMHSFNEGILS